MIRVILFDMGGTLDGEVHWLERFLALYRSFGMTLPRESIRAAFDEAERRCATDETIVSANFEQMTQMHVEWQLEHLGLENPKLRQHLVEGFIKPIHTTTAENVHMLSNLVKRGFTLGVVSNGCGNVDALCADFGYAPFLSIIVDSRRVRLFKPDPAIFQYAAKQLGGDPATMIMVGDSFERDIVPARKTGMKTAWIEGPDPRECPDPSLIDLRLQRLVDLPSALSEASLVRACASALSLSNGNSSVAPFLKAGIFAAGHGQRLQTPARQLKPLVTVNEKPLIAHVLNAMAEANASEVVIIINEDGLAVRDYVTSLTWPFTLRWIVETTPSSMHSFIRLIETLSATGDTGPFLLSTVDTVAGNQAYAQFIDAARRYDWAAVTLALTSAGDDEKPLLVRMASDNTRIAAIGPTAAPSELATAGVYAVRASILHEAEAAQRDGLDSLRAFLGRLLERGYQLAGIPISQSIDVDRPTDIGIAEAFLRSTAR